jgi:hypothetical protein
MTAALKNWVRDALSEHKRSGLLKEAELWIQTFSDDVTRIAS